MVQFQLSFQCIDDVNLDNAMKTLAAAASASALTVEVESNEWELKRLPKKVKKQLM